MEKVDTSLQTENKNEIENITNSNLEEDNKSETELGQLDDEGSMSQIWKKVLKIV